MYNVYVYVYISRLKVASELQGQEEAYACTSSGPHDHYSELCIYTDGSSKI